eukprot:2294766-Pleurochrysis_carterae.AAC.3
MPATANDAGPSLLRTCHTRLSRWSNLCIKKSEKSEKVLALRWRVRVNQPRMRYTARRSPHPHRIFINPQQTKFFIADYNGTPS